MNKKGKDKNLVNSKLVRLLSQMDTEEIKQFKSFIKVKGKKSMDALQVLKYLFSVHPTYTSRQLTNEVVYKKVFPSQPFSYPRLMKAVSLAHSDLKQFLIADLLQKDTFLSDYLLAKVYAQKRLSHDLSLLLEKKNTHLIPILTPNTI